MMKITKVKREWNPLGLFFNTFQKRRERVIIKLKSSSEAEGMDSIGIYPIIEARILDNVSFPHKMLLLATLYLKNANKKIEHDITELIAFYKLTDTNTETFVFDNINPLLSKYEIDYRESAYLYQLVFDNYEWRTFVYHIIRMEIPGADSLIRIDSKNKQIIVEKRAPFKPSLMFNFGHYIACLSYALRMTQKNAITDLTTVKEGKYDASIEDDQFVFRVKTCLPPIGEIEIGTLKERYLQSLSTVINYKLSIRSV